MLFKLTCDTYSILMTFPPFSCLSEGNKNIKINKYSKQACAENAILLKSIA